jgi:hypothetical protein
MGPGGPACDPHLVRYIGIVTFAGREMRDPHREKWGRSLRWYEQLRALDTSPDRNAMTVVDTALAFFTSAYHLRDWVAASRPDLDSALTDFMNDPQLRLVRDLVNADKHLELTRPIRPAPRIVREYVPGPRLIDPPSHRLVVLGSLGKVELLGLAVATRERWRVFLSHHRLI